MATAREAKTQLRAMYEALSALKEGEQTALAEFHADEDRARLLVHRFKKDLETLESMQALSESFYPETGRTELPDPPTPVDAIRNEIQFVSQVKAAGTCTVDANDALNFRYVDRQLAPLRTDPSWLDLLLATTSEAGRGTPILAEVKLRADKPTYYALIQLLMYAVELLAPAQRERFKGHPPAADLLWHDTGPFADVYIISFEPPQTGAFRQRSFEASRKISDRLMTDSVVSDYIGRIAYVEAERRDGKLGFKERFAFGPGAAAASR